MSARRRSVRGWARSLALAALLATAVAGCGGGIADPVTAAGSAAAPALAPYVDASVAPDRLLAMADATGVTGVVLAFALATDGRCAPSWGGVRPLDDPALLAQVGELRRRGGEITVATGGALGHYLENACASADALAAAYSQVLDVTRATGLAVDIEADVPTGTVVRALSRVQAERGTKLTLTLPVANQDEGLEPGALDRVRRADEAGLRFAVDAMVMNFPYRGTWRRAMADALDATAAQLRGLDARLGVTVMIGRTDTGAVTTLEDARAVVEHARSRGLDHVRFWSLGRDNGGCPGSTAAAFDCSGLAQADFAFTHVFRDALGAPAVHRNEQDGA